LLQILTAALQPKDPGSPREQQKSPLVLPQLLQQAEQLLSDMHREDASAAAAVDAMMEAMEMSYTSEVTSLADAIVGANAFFTMTAVPAPEALDVADRQDLLGQDSQPGDEDHVGVEEKVAWMDSKQHGSDGANCVVMSEQVVKSSGMSAASVKPNEGASCIICCLPVPHQVNCCASYPNEHLCRSHRKRSNGFRLGSPGFCTPGRRSKRESFTSCCR
jgi:hypothetical protein